MSDIIELNINFPDFAAILKKNKRKIEIFIAAQMQFNRGMLFDKEGAYNGHKKWKSLAFRQGQILSKRGSLRKSLAPVSANGKPGPGGIVKMGGGVITIGSGLIYAWMMNWGTTKLPGGVLKPKNAKALKIPLPGGKAATDLTKSMKKKGGKATKISTGKKTKTGRDVKQSVLFVKSVKIPARRYDDWTSEDQQEITIALRNYLQELMKGN